MNHQLRTLHATNPHTNLWCQWFTRHSNSNFACSTCKVKSLCVDTMYALESKLNSLGVIRVQVGTIKLVLILFWYVRRRFEPRNSSSKSTIWHNAKVSCISLASKIQMWAAKMCPLLSSLMQWAWLKSFETRNKAEEQANSTSYQALSGHFFWISLYTYKQEAQK